MTKQSMLTPCAFFLLLTQCWSGPKKLVYCTEGAPSSFNPQLVSDGTSFDASSQALYNRLLDFKEDTTELVPSLAESWEVSEAGTQIRFKLKKGVSFHSTEGFQPQRDFNAEDVLFTFQRMSQKDHPYHKVSGGDYRYYNSMQMGRNLKSIEKLSDHEVVFHLKKPEAPFLANLAMDFASILSAEYAEHLQKKNKKNWIDSKPVGTGPFQLKTYVENKKILYVKNQDYFEGEPELELLKFLIVPDSEKRFQKTLEGQCDFAKALPFKKLNLLKSSKKLEVLEQPGLNVSYLAMNQKTDKLKNKDLRKAISYALNKRRYLRSVYDNKALLAKSPLPPGVWAYDDSLPDLDYDLEKAKEHIKKSKLSVPIDLELWTLPISRPYNPDGRLMGEMIKQDLSKIGVEVELMTYDWPTYLKKISKAEHEMVLYGWTGDNGDPDNFLNLLLSCDGAKGGTNVAQYCNPRYDKLVHKAQSSRGLQRRKKIYKKALRLFQKDLPWVPIAHSKVYKVMNKDLKGYVNRPIGTESFFKVRFEEKDEKP